MKPFLTVGYIPYIKEWYDSKQDTVYSSISLTTMQLPCFTQLRFLWYVNGIKIIPKNIQKLLTPIALALPKGELWVMVVNKMKVYI
jgi:hypothetical protein